jgi:hypothetical protein
MPVVAGLVDGLLVPTPVADQYVAAERTGAARQKAFEDASTMWVTAVSLSEGVGMTPKRIQHGQPLRRPRRGSAVMMQLQLVVRRDRVGDHVRVNPRVACGRFWAGVAEEDLDQAQVIAVLDEPRGEGAAEVVGADP